MFPHTYVPNKNRSEQVGNKPVINEIPSSYANKLSPTSLTKANLRKLDATMPNDVDYDVGLPLASVHQLEDKQLVVKKNIYCLVDEQVHLDAKVGADIIVTGVPRQEGALGNAAERKKVEEV
ncbi:hypothetical protein Tco_1296914 [Tanacetum coccineum]